MTNKAKALLASFAVGLSIGIFALSARALGAHAFQGQATDESVSAADALQGQVTDESASAADASQGATGESAPVEVLANEYGQTYGPGFARPTPDLVLVGLRDGVTGYIYSKDMHSDEAKNPEEAVARMKKLRDLLAKAKEKDPSTDHVVIRTLPVYKSDGKTVVGTWEIVYTDPSTNPTHEELQKLIEEGKQ
jgi:hypothetical protein